MTGSSIDPKPCEFFYITQDKEAESGTSKRRRNERSDFFIFICIKFKILIHTHNIKHRNTYVKSTVFVELEERTGNDTNTVRPKQRNLDYKRLSTLQF